MKKLIKRVVGESFIESMDDYRAYLREGQALLASKFGVLAVVGALFSPRFMSEYRAAMSGIYLYHKRIRLQQYNSFYLRRNVHRIEKGLSMQPMRSEFATRFIGATVDAYRAALNGDITPEEKQWTHDVLTEYFVSTKSNDSKYQSAAKAFKSIKILVETDRGSQRLVPYVANGDRKLTYDDVYGAMVLRKSVRWFSTKPVERYKLEKALRVSSLTPSSCNRQPYRYYYSVNPPVAGRLAAISAGTVGWSHNVSAILVVVGQMDAYETIDGRHSLYVDGALSVMPLVLALETLGLSSCIINWTDNPAAERKMIKELGLSSCQKVVTSIAVGYADKSGKVAYSKRKSVSDISKEVL